MCGCIFLMQRCFLNYKVRKKGQKRYIVCALGEKQDVVKEGLKYYYKYKFTRFNVLHSFNFLYVSK